MANLKRLELSDMIVALRSELVEARKKAESEGLRFSVDSIDLETQVTVSCEGTAGAKAKWKFWIFSEAEAGIEGTVGRETVQTVRLRLTPVLEDEGKLLVCDEDDAPGR